MSQVNVAILLSLVAIASVIAGLIIVVLAVRRRGVFDEAICHACGESVARFDGSVLSKCGGCKVDLTERGDAGWPIRFGYRKSGRRLLIIGLITMLVIPVVMSFGATWYNVRVNKRVAMAASVGGANGGISSAQFLDRRFAKTMKNSKLEAILLRSILCPAGWQEWEFRVRQGRITPDAAAATMQAVIDTIRANAVPGPGQMLRIGQQPVGHIVGDAFDTFRRLGNDGLLDAELVQTFAMDTLVTFSLIRSRIDDEAGVTTVTVVPRSFASFHRSDPDETLFALKSVRTKDGTPIPILDQTDGGPMPRSLSRHVIGAVNGVAMSAPLRMVPGQHSSDTLIFTIELGRVRGMANSQIFSLMTSPDEWPKSTVRTTVEWEVVLGSMGTCPNR